MKRRFFTPSATVALAFLLLEALCVLLLPLLLNTDPNTIHPDAGFWSPPSFAHLLGTDAAGRDLFARLLEGGRVSLLIGFGAAFLSAALGLPLGLLAGWFRGGCEMAVMRTADVVQTFPSILLTLAVCALFGGSVGVIILTLGVLGWPSVARPIYANALIEREREYVLAARALGIGERRIVLRHVLPNTIAPFWAALPLRIGRAILSESGLSFLGAGLRPPQSSWGGLLSAAAALPVLAGRPWVWVPPGVLIALTVLACQVLADAMQEAFDTKK